MSYPCLSSSNNHLLFEKRLFFSFEMVSDGQYHIAELIAIKKNFTLRVDRGLARSIINDGPKDYLKLTTPMYLGGIPPEPGEHAFTDWHLRNLTSFSGKFNNIQIYCLLMHFNWNGLVFENFVLYWERVTATSVFRCVLYDGF